MTPTMKFARFLTVNIKRDMSQDKYDCARACVYKCVRTYVVGLLFIPEVR